MAEFVGVLHVHSTFSDGVMSLAEIREWALTEELDFVCVTDHSKRLRDTRLAEFCSECERLSTNVLLVPGVEFEHSGRHVLTIAPADVLTTLTDEIAVRDPETVRQRGGLTIWAHPSLTYAVSLRDAVATPYDGWEIWNRKVDGPAPNLPVLSLLRGLGSGREILSFAGLDMHEQIGDTLPRLSLRTAESELTLASLIDSMRAGDYTIVIDAARSMTPNSRAINLSLSLRVRSYARHATTRARCTAAALKHRVLTGVWP